MRRGLLIGAGALVLLVAGGFGFLALSDASDRRVLADARRDGALAGTIAAARADARYHRRLLVVAVGVPLVAVAVGVWGSLSAVGLVEGPLG